MRRSSKTSYTGVVRIKPGRYRAFYKKGLSIKTISTHDTAEAAARAFDEYALSKKGIERAFDMLNFPTDAHRQALENKKLERIEHHRLREETRTEQLRSTSIQEQDLRRLSTLFNQGVPIEELASTFGTHQDVVISTLRTLEQSRLASIVNSKTSIQRVNEDESLLGHVDE